MRTLKNWGTKRSGASMTVTGTNVETGTLETVPGVIALGVGQPSGVFAETDKGETLQLEVSA